MPLQAKIDLSSIGDIAQFPAMSGQCLSFQAVGDGKAGIQIYGTNCPSPGVPGGVGARWVLVGTTDSAGNALLISPWGRHCAKSTAGAAEVWVCDLIADAGRATDLVTQVIGYNTAAVIGESAGFVSRVGTAFQSMPDTNAGTTTVQGWETWYLGPEWRRCRAVIANIINPRNAGAAVGTFSASIFCADVAAAAGREYDDPGNRFGSVGPSGIASLSIGSGQSSAAQFQISGPYLLVGARNSDSGSPGPNVSPGLNLFFTLLY